MMYNLTPDGYNLRVKGRTLKPVILSDLEVHLVVHHRVKPELVGELEERHPDKREQVAHSSHALMHMTGLTESHTPHTHPEFDIT
jgi:hypothetical protein